MKFEGKYTENAGSFILEIPPQGALTTKVTVYESSYAKAVERAQTLIEEITLDKEPVIQVLLID